MGLYIFLCGWKDLYENGHTILLATKTLSIWHFRVFPEAGY